MPTPESFLMGKPLPIVELSQELPLTPFQIGVPSFILPYIPCPHAQFSLVCKTSKPGLPLFCLGCSVCLGSVRRKDGDSPLQEAQCLVPTLEH